MPIKFYTDEHIPKAVVRELRRQGVDVLSTPEAGMRGATDDAHLAFATSLGRVLVTQDDDFLALHTSGIHHTGIAYAARRVSLGALISSLLLIQQVYDADEMLDHVEYL